MGWKKKEKKGKEKEKKKKKTRVYKQPQTLLHLQILSHTILKYSSNSNKSGPKKRECSPKGVTLALSVVHCT